MKGLFTRLLKCWRNASLKTKYVSAFLGITVISYAILFGSVYARIMHYEMGNLQNFLNGSMEQAREFVEYEIKQASYASETLYFERDTYLALEGCVNEAERDPGQEYRYWAAMAALMQSLEIGNICDVRIYAPDNYVYNDTGRYFTAISSLDPTVLAGLEGKGERAVWSAPLKLALPFAGAQQQVVSLTRKVVQQDDYSKILCVEQISLPVDSICRILQNADSTESGFVYLTNADHKLIAGSKPDMAGLMDTAGPVDMAGLMDVTGSADMAGFVEMEGRMVEEGHLDQGWNQWEIGGQACMVNRVRLPSADWAMTAVIPLKELEVKSRRVCNGLFWGLLPMMGASTCFTYFFAAGFSVRIKKLSHQISNWRDQESLQVVSMEPDDEVGRLSREYRDMRKEIDGLLRQQYELGIAIKGAELKALQAQINPHFLYNTLDLINWEAMALDAPEIGELVQMLAKYYKSVLGKGFDVVTLRHEIEHIETYVKIQNFRFDGRIRLAVDVSEGLLDRRLLKLMLQPLIENSIAHGLSMEAEVTITVKAWAEEDDLVIVVADNGKGMSKEQLEDILKVDEDNSHYAVSNIHSRIQLKYGPAYGLTYESAKGQGTSVAIRIRSEEPI